jgi:hypothetical protein
MLHDPCMNEKCDRGFGRYHRSHPANVKLIRVISLRKLNEAIPRLDALTGALDRRLHVISEEQEAADPRAGPQS